MPDYLRSLGLTSEHSASAARLNICLQTLGRLMGNDYLQLDGGAFIAANPGLWFAW